MNLRSPTWDETVDHLGHLLQTRATAKKSSKYRNRIQFMIWYVITGVIIFLTLVHWSSWAISKWRSRRYRDRQLELRRGSDETVIHTARPIRHGELKASSAGTTALEATRAMWRNNLYLRVLPMWIYSSSSVAEIFWTVAYAGITTGIVAYALVGDKRNDALGRVDFANPFGLAAYAQVPLIVGLASKNNVISFLTGISYQKLNYLHRASARICLLHSWLHVYGRITLGVGTGTEFPLDEGLMIWGIIAILGLTVSFLTSFRIVRHYLYEFFIITHIVFVLAFLLGAFYHWSKLNHFIWPGILLWSLDRFASLCRMVWVNKAWLPLAKRKQVGECTVELVDPEVMRITVKCNMRWQAGQHAFITMPSIATLRYEQHPFTIANADVLNSNRKRSGEAVFLVRAYDGFTRRLRDSLDSEKTKSIKAYLDGPYGQPPSLEGYDTVVLLAGGTGISYALSHFLQLLNEVERTPVRQIRLIWNVRHAAHVQWISPMLNQAIQQWRTKNNSDSELDLRIVIHVTRSHMADEPGDERGVTDVVGAVTSAAAGHLHEKAHNHGHRHEQAQEDDEKNEKQEKGKEVGEEPKPESGDTSASASRSPTLHNSSSSSSSSSTASIDETTEKRKNSSLAPSYGLSEDVSRLLSFAKGRVDVDTLLQDVVGEAQGSIHVSVCGPEELALTTRRAVTRVNSTKKIMAGQPVVEYYGESYGW